MSNEFYQMIETSRSNLLTLLSSIEGDPVSANSYVLVPAGLPGWALKFTETDSLQGIVFSDPVAVPIGDSEVRFFIEAQAKMVAVSTFNGRRESPTPMTYEAAIAAALASLDELAVSFESMANIT